MDIWGLLLFWCCSQIYPSVTYKIFHCIGISLPLLGLPTGICSSICGYYGWDYFLIYFSACLTLVYKKELIFMSLIVWLFASLLKVFIISKTFLVESQLLLLVASYHIHKGLFWIPHHISEQWFYQKIGDIKLKTQDLAWITPLCINRP